MPQNNAWFVDDRVLLDLVQETAGPRTTWLSSTVAANMAASVLLLLAFRTQAPAAMLYGWFSASIAYQLLRTFVTKSYWNSAPTSGQPLHCWADLLSLLSICSGLMWGLAGWLFYAPDSGIHQTLISVLMCGLAAGSIPANAMLKPAIVGSTLALLGLFIVRLLVESDLAHGLMAAMLAVYLAFVLKWGRQLNAVLVESLRRQHENSDLIEKLHERSESALLSQKNAEQANIAKSKFLAAASHDLRQPMHALTLFAESMRHEKRPEELGKLTGHIVQSVEALEMLFNSLLDISKLDAGVVQPRQEEFALQSLFSRLQNDFSPMAADKGLRLSIRRTHAGVRTDVQLLEQILRNLVANAIRYSEQGGVVVGARKQGDAWRIDVVDSGIGIDDSERETIFGEFYQIGNPERDRTKGLGLGLAIVRRLVDLLGLRLSFRSRPGRGTTFTLIVPAGQALLSPPGNPGEQQVSFNALRVLVVDDEREVRTALSMLLGSWGCDVVETDSLAGVRDAIKGKGWRPELAVVDFRLREGKTGTAILDWLREQGNAALTGVIITGDTAVDELKEVRDSGYLIMHKPASPARLRALLRNVAEKRSPHP